jgi:exosortase
MTTSVGPLAVSVVFLMACYWQTLAALISDWLHNEVSGHGIPVLLFVVFCVWRDWDRLSARPAQPLRAGFLLILWGGVQAIAASLGAELFLARTAFLLALAGVLLFHLGLRFFDDVISLWLLLGLTVPLPAILYNPFTIGLQSAASVLTESLVYLANIPLRWEGNSMVFAGGGEQVRPVDGFGALRLAWTLIAGAIGWGEFRRRRTWVRLALVVVVLGIAVGLSSIRIAFVAWLDDTVSAAWALQVLENLGSWSVVMLSLVLMIAVEHLAGRVFWPKS